MIGKLRLFSDESGTSVIELALVAPLLATLIIGTVDIARAASFKLGLEQCVQRSIEKVQQYQESTSTFSTLQNEVVSAANAAGYSDVNTSNVTLDYWLECNGVRQGDGTPGNGYDASCADGDTYARYVTVTVTSKYTPYFGTRYFPGANADGTVTMSAEAGIRTQ